jgi:hypothetical protein
VDHSGVQSSIVECSGGQRRVMEYSGVHAHYTPLYSWLRTPALLTQWLTSPAVGFGVGTIVFVGIGPRRMWGSREYEGGVGPRRSKCSKFIVSSPDDDDDDDDDDDGGGGDADDDNDDDDDEEGQVKHVDRQQPCEYTVNTQ